MSGKRTRVVCWEAKESTKNETANVIVHTRTSTRTHVHRKVQSKERMQTRTLGFELCSAGSEVASDSCGASTVSSSGRRPFMRRSTFMTGAPLAF